MYTNSKYLSTQGLGLGLGFKVRYGVRAKVKAYAHFEGVKERRNSGGGLFLTW